MEPHLRIRQKEMDQIRIPQGIKTLRRLEMDNGITIPRGRFEKLVNSLDRCADDSRPKTIRCDSCPYLDECLERFDAICGRVVMYRRKCRAMEVSQP
jgi:hypothetical protein